jgi:hypothetical protein
MDASIMLLLFLMFNHDVAMGGERALLRARSRLRAGSP